jgi:NAD/NADP transhydrogenase alpha subunit
MDIDESHGIKASFQIVSEERYPVTPEFLDQLRARGFEVCVHDRIGVKIAVKEARLSSKGQGLVTLHLEVTKQDGQVVQRGETTFLTRLRPVKK